MTKTIWKYEQQLDDEITIHAPISAKIIHVAGGGHGILTFWAEVDPSEPKVNHTLAVVGTGNPIPSAAVHHLATVIAPPFVWHVYRKASA